MGTHTIDPIPCSLCLYNPPGSGDGKPCSMCPAQGKPTGLPQLWREDGRKRRSMSKVTDILEAIPLCEAYMDGVDDGCSSCPYNGRCSELVKDTMDTLRDLEQRVPRWISVEERLPDEVKYVLVAAPYEDNVLQQVAFLFKGGWYVYGAGEIAPTVTHWMPLPEPPDNEKEGSHE